MFDMYEVVYWITGVLVVLAFYNVILSFSSEEPRNPKQDTIIMVSYYFLSLLVHYFANYPLVNLALTIGLFIAICVSLGMSWKKSITVIIYAVAIMTAIEAMVGFGTGYVAKSIVQEAEYSSIVGRLASAIISYSVATAMRRFKHVKKDVHLPISYWLMTILYPLLSVFLLLLIFSYSEVHRGMVMFGAAIILSMNVLLFTLYDRLIRLYEKKMEDAAVKSLNKSYQQQLDLMRSSVQETMSIKHDFMKHLNSMETLIMSKEPDKAKKYLSDVRNQVSASEMFSHTGNMIIDSIINFNYNRSEIDQSRVSLKIANLPNELEIAEHDLTIILSNLLTNAFRATKATDHGQMTIQIEYNKGMLFIKIINDYSWLLNMENGVYATNQDNKEQHGYGLKNVLRAVEKYDGQLTLTTTDQQFCAETLMYESHV